MAFGNGSYARHLFLNDEQQQDNFNIRRIFVIAEFACLVILFYLITSSLPIIWNLLFVSSKDRDEGYTSDNSFGTYSRDVII